MTKQELSKLLGEKNIRPDAYELEGGLPNEAYTLNYTGSIWEVYYSERGLKSGLKVFQNEHEACEYFYALIIKAIL